MDTVIEYFVRHYTLVMNNDQSTHYVVREVIREVLSDSDVTLTQYRAMTAHDRAVEFASAIGGRVLDLIDEWYLDQIKERDSIGGLLIREIMYTSGDDLGFALGRSYLPEDDDADNFFSDDEDTDDDDEAAE